MKREKFENVRVFQREKERERENRRMKKSGLLRFGGRRVIHQINLFPALSLSHSLVCSNLQVQNQRKEGGAVFVMV